MLNNSGMTDYSDAASSAGDALSDAADGGMVEEYEIRSGAGSRKVKRGKVVDQIKGAALLEGLAARRSAGGLFRVSKRRHPR